ncbi:MAG: methionyl-tRNA formyltransferase, partial [Gemmataceae bacterium]
MRLVMMGTGLFAEPTLEALLSGPHPVVGLVTQPDRAAGAERGSTRQTGRGMKNIAVEKGVPVLQPASINTPEGVAALRDLQPDLLVVAAYGQILSRDVLAVPPHGGINVHASLLPKYRGAAPIAWAIYHGETHTGVTIIKMSVSLDAGDMLAQEAIDIGEYETAGEVEARLAPLGARLALQVIEQIENGTVQGRKQDPSQVTKAPKLKKENGLIDWNRGAEEVCNHIRAMQPWPTSYTFWHRLGQSPLRVIITEAVPFPVRYDPSVPPGSIIIEPSMPKSLLVTAGLIHPEERSVIEIFELQPAGKRRMTAEEFLRGHK